MKPPAFQFYADDFLAGVADMTQAEVGAYILLLCSQWSRGEIPQDQGRCAMIAKGEVSAFVFGKFPNGKNARLERVRAEQDEFRASRSVAGKIGAQKRWHGDSTAIAQPLHPHSTATVLPMANGMANDSSPSPSPSPSPISTLDLPKTLGEPASPPAPTTRPKTAKIARTDADLIAAYSANPAYRGIDVTAQLHKMRAWCAVNRKEPTERRFVNWLNRTDKPLGGDPLNGAIMR